MDYSKMKKEDLINEIVGLHAQVKQNEHLATTVEAKDREIIRLQNEVQRANDKKHEEIKNISEELDRAIKSAQGKKTELDLERASINSKIRAAVEDERKRNQDTINEVRQGYEDEFQRFKTAQKVVIDEYKEKVEALEKALSAAPDPQRVKQVIEKFEAENNRLVNFVNTYRGAFRNFLSSVTGLTENTAGLETLLFSQLQNTKPQEEPEKK